MKKRCRFCGQKIHVDENVCQHCGKTLIKKEEKSDDNKSLVGLESWQEKTIPAWLMYAVIAIALLCLIVMFSKGCESREPVDAASRNHICIC